MSGQFVLDRLGDKQILKCRACGHEYIPFVPLKIFPKLVFDRGDRESFLYELSVNGNVIIKRDPDDHDYVKIQIEHVHDSHAGINTCIRNPFISRKHVMIAVNEKYELVEENNIQKIVLKKKCFIKDLGSKFGTSVNDEPLKPYMLKELKNNDKIILSPESEMPLTIFYQE